MQFSIACLISCSAELLLNRHTRKRAPLGLKRFACDGSRHSFTTENRQGCRKPHGKPFCISQRENSQKLLFFLYRKLRCISYKAKSAPRGSHCGGTEFVASRPAAGGESCGAGFYFYFLILKNLKFF